MALQKAYVITTLGKHPYLNFQVANADNIIDDGCGPKKRRRLTHLSAEQKMLRRKMKNRIAAQTARDRKKMRMEELELQMAELQKENQQLQKENSALRHNQGVFEKENLRLKLMKSLISSTPSPEPTTVMTATATSASSPVKQSLAAAAPTSLLKSKAQQQDSIAPACQKLEEQNKGVAWVQQEKCSVTLVDEGVKDSLTVKVKEEPAAASVAASPCKVEPESPGSAVPPVSLPKEQPQDLPRLGMQIASCALTLSLILCFNSWKNSVLQWGSPAAVHQERRRLMSEATATATRSVTQVALAGPTEPAPDNRPWLHSGCTSETMWAP